MTAQIKRSLRFGTSIFALVISSLAALTRGAGAQTAGSVGAVNPNASGTPPGGSTRSLSIGDPVVRNERLQTSSTGTLHVTFSDKTTLNLGPSASIVIDSYVYNPTTGLGALRASVVSGLVRMVGGQISHTTGMTVNTPVATIGIRGNMVIIERDSACGWQVTSLAPGEVSVTNDVSQQVISRPGFTVCVSSRTSPIPVPTRANPAAVQQAFNATLSRPGQNGGAIHLPTDSQAQRAGVGAAPLPSQSGSPLDYLGPFVTQQSVGRNSAQGRQPGQVQSNPPPANPYGSR